MNFKLYSFFLFFYCKQFFFINLIQNHKGNEKKTKEKVLGVTPSINRDKVILYELWSIGPIILSAIF